MHGCIIIPQGTKIRINLTFFFRFLPSNFEKNCWFLKQFLDFRALCFVWWTPCIVQLQLSRRRRRKDYREHHHHQPLEDGGACCCCYCNGDDFAKALEFSYFVSQWASRAYFARSWGQQILDAAVLQTTHCVYYTTTRRCRMLPAATRRVFQLI